MRHVVEHMVWVLSMYRGNVIGAVLLDVLREYDHRNIVLVVSVSPSDASGTSVVPAEWIRRCASRVIQRLSRKPEPTHAHAQLSRASLVRLSCLTRPSETVVKCATCLHLLLAPLTPCGAWFFIRKLLALPDIDLRALSFNLGSVPDAAAVTRARALFSSIDPVSVARSGNDCAELHEWLRSVLSPTIAGCTLSSWRHQTFSHSLLM